MTTDQTPQTEETTRVQLAERQSEERHERVTIDTTYRVRYAFAATKGQANFLATIQAERDYPDGAKVGGTIKVLETKRDTKTGCYDVSLRINWVK